MSFFFFLRFAITFDKVLFYLTLVINVITH